MGFTNKQNKITYFNFAIQLLENFLKEKETVLENIFDYAIYVKATSLYSKSELRNGEIALSYFGVASRDLETTLKVGKLLYGSFPQNSPKVGLNTKIWMAYLKKNKTEFEDVTLLAFLALKSILGKKSYCKVVNKYWLARMDGKPKSIENYDELSPEIFKYSTEYQTVKIKKALEESWGLKTYSFHTRGFYASFNMTIKELAIKAEQLKKSNKDREYQALKKEAREEAIERLKGERSSHEL